MSNEKCYFRVEISEIFFPFEILFTLKTDLVFQLLDFQLSWEERGGEGEWGEGGGRERGT